MSMKTMSLILCVALTLSVVGCGRSKPESSKTAGVDTSSLENTTPPPPPDQLPPKSTAVAAVPPVHTPAPSSGAASFGPLPPAQDKAGEVTRQKLADAAAKIAENKKGAELEQKRVEEVLKQQQGEAGNNNGQQQ